MWMRRAEYPDCFNDLRFHKNRKPLVLCLEKGWAQGVFYVADKAQRLCYIDRQGLCTGSSTKKAV
jgi:hypothetical protein